VRNHQLIGIWVELYVALRHIGSPKSRVSKTDREVITALERKGSRGCSARRGGWSCGACVPEKWQRVAQTSRGLGVVRARGRVVWLCVTDHIGVTTVKDDT
jgi:hypothetical protein